MMPLLAEIVGWLIIIEGILFLGEPRALEYFVRFFIKGKRLYIASALRVAAAALLIMAADSAKVSWLAALCAVILLLSGFAGFLMGLKTQKQMLAISARDTGPAVRISGLMVLIFGMAVVYSF